MIQRRASFDNKLRGCQREDIDVVRQLRFVDLASNLGVRHHVPEAQPRHCHRFRKSSQHDEIPIVGQQGIRTLAAELMVSLIEEYQTYCIFQKSNESFLFEKIACRVVWRANNNNIRRSRGFQKLIDIERQPLGVEKDFIHLGLESGSHQLIERERRLRHR